MWSNYRIKRLLCGVRCAFYANVMLRLWRSRVTDCDRVATVPVTCSFDCRYPGIGAVVYWLPLPVDIPEVGSLHREPITKNSAVFSAFLFYREAFCYFQKANLFHYRRALSCVKSFSFCTQMSAPVTSTHSTGKCARARVLH